MVFLGFPQNRAGLKIGSSDGDDDTEAGDPLRQWLSRLASRAGRFLRQDRRALRELWGNPMGKVEEEEDSGDFAMENME